MPCHSGVGLTPTVDGREHRFSAGGLLNGLFLLVDDETETYWNHISGEALHGPLAGRALEAWPVRMTSAAEALDRDPTLELYRSRPGLLGRIMGRFSSLGMRSMGMIAPFVALKVSQRDTRLEQLENGLGVVEGDEARFYRLEDARRGLTDTLGGRALSVACGADGIPGATWQDDGTRPLQLFTRWYGFSFTYPGCGIYDGDSR